MLEPSRSLFGTEAPVCFEAEIFLLIMPSTLSLPYAIRTKRCAGLESKGLAS